MKRILLFAGLILAASTQAQVHVSWLWHMQQPIYWPEVSQTDPYSYQKVWESQQLKSSGANTYSDGLAHPLNDLFDIFSKADRVAAYQFRPKDAVGNLLGYPEAGAQVNYSGCLIENVNSLADQNAWGYFPGWEGNFQTARSWTTSGGNSRMDMTGFSFHHVLSPLVSDEVLRKELQAHKLIYGETFGLSPNYSKGYWPAECAFSERIIPVLVDEGFEWSVVANSHIARTLSDYPLVFGTNGSNGDAPNQADQVALTGSNWWDGQLDGRGGTFAAPISYQAHWARYIDPVTGAEDRMIIVPMADLLSYQDGFSAMSTSDIDAHIAPYEDPTRPSLVLLAHDGDNAYGGGFDYYLSSVPGFAGAAAANGYVPSTVQQYLDDHPVPSSDLVHVEDGSWFNAANDWGHPQFINWLWPQYTPGHRFDPAGWTEDIRNFAVLTAAENHAQMAEDLDGGTDINDIVHPGPSSSNAELAWHFLLPGFTSGYMYYGSSIDMEVKQTLAANRALAYADLEIAANPGVDFTPPSVFIPQRYPYNPGAQGFGPNYGYSIFNNPSDFDVWTLAYDVSGLSSVSLKYREDFDGVNDLSTTDNETYAGGADVSSWQTKAMTERVMPVGNITGNPEIDFFILPDQIASQYYAPIEGFEETLIDYYVEAIDSAGNIHRSAIQHVYVGEFTSSSGGTGSTTVSWSPVDPSIDSVIIIEVTGATLGASLHWGLTVGGTAWTSPDPAYWPAGSAYFSGPGSAVETPFVGPDTAGTLRLILGPFNDPTQLPSAVNFVIHYDNDTWDNNSGADYLIPISGSGGVTPGVTWTPTNPTELDVITVTIGAAPTTAKLHWGVDQGSGPWNSPDPVYWPASSYLFGGSGPAVESPMNSVGSSTLEIQLGPFNDPAQEVDFVDFVVHYDDDSWDNNGGADYRIPIQEAACQVPVNLQSNVTSSTTASLSWDSVSGATSYLLQGRKVGSGAKQLILPESTTSFNLSGLIPSSDYQWRIQSICGLESAPFSAIQNFTTPSLRDEELLSWDVWPIPASDQINWHWRGAQDGDILVRLFAADGRVVYSSQSTSNQDLIPVSGIAAGMYYLELENGGQRLSRAVVVE